MNQDIKKTNQKTKKALFFSTDALIALIIIFITILVIYPQISMREDNGFIQKDFVKVFSTLKTNEVNDPYIQNLIFTGRIQNPDRTIIEQIGELYVINKTLAKEFTEKLLAKIKTNENIGIWVNGYLIANKSSSSFEEALDIDVDRQFITGIMNNSYNRTGGVSARAYFLNKRQTKYYFFGGYIGDGNISFIMNYSGTIQKVRVELNINENFEIYVNGNFAGYYVKSIDEFTPKIYDVPVGNFNDGENLIEIRGDNLHITGGYLKIEYDTDKIVELEKRYQIPGIKGAINIYDGFYIPNNLDEMNLQINFSSNYTMFMTIGNTTIFSGTSLGANMIKIMDNGELKGLLDNYDDIRGKNVPIRIGLENVTKDLGAKADIVFIIDSTGSMQGEIYQVRDIAKNFAAALKDGKVDFRLAIMNVKDYPDIDCGTSDDVAYNIFYFGDDYIIDNTDGKLWDGEFINMTVNSRGYISLLEDPTLNFSYILGEQIKYAGEYNITYDDHLFGQSFGTTVNGYIENVTINVTKYEETQTLPPLIMEIRNRSITGEVLGSTEIESNKISDLDFNLINFSFDVNTRVDAFNTYYIVLKVKDNGFGWRGDENNYYKVVVSHGKTTEQVTFDPSGLGEFYFSTDNDNTWKSIRTNDMFYSMRVNTISVAKYGLTSYVIDYNKTVKVGDLSVSSNIGVGSLTWRSTVSTSNDNISWSEYKKTQDFLSLPPGRYVRINTTFSTDGKVNTQLTSLKVTTDNVKFTNNVTRFINKVNSISAWGGNDIPEAHLTGLNASIFSMDWRNGANKFDILLTDAPPHALDCEVGGITTYKACYKGPEYIREIIDKLVTNKITVYLVNTIDAECDNQIMEQNLTNETKGESYRYDKAGNIKDIILAIAQKIINVSYSAQTAVITGDDIPSLYTGSFIELKYPQEPINLYGSVITFEKNFDNKFSGNFSIPESSNILEVKVVSYSGSRWTDQVVLNDKSIFNLSEYGKQFIFLGDPYKFNLPIGSIEGQNNITITTAYSADNSTEGSINNKIIYKIIKNFSSFSPILAGGEGCKWTIKFEDLTTAIIKIPEGYNGLNICEFMPTAITYDSNDAIQVATYNLLRSLDNDNNKLCDIKFNEENLIMNFSQISGIPFAWSTEIQIRRWR